MNGARSDKTIGTDWSIVLCVNRHVTHEAKHHTNLVNNKDNRYGRSHIYPLLACQNNAALMIAGLELIFVVELPDLAYMTDVRFCPPRLFVAMGEKNLSLNRNWLLNRLVSSHIHT